RVRSSRCRSSSMRETWSKSIPGAAIISAGWRRRRSRRRAEQLRAGVSSMARREDSRASGTRGASLDVTELVELATRHNLAELEVESGGTRIRVVREHPAASAMPPVERSATAFVSGKVSPAGELTGEPNLVTIEAPMVGTFYRASAPDAAPYVSE